MVSLAETSWEDMVAMIGGVYEDLGMKKNDVGHLD